MKHYSFLFIIGIIFFSCSKEDYEATIPAYISIPSISLTTDYATEGSASSNITDAWVFINDDLVGVYELPAKFPVLKEGNVTVKVFAGIRDNGIAASRVRYLLYEPHVESVQLVKSETVEISANVNYSSEAKFSWLEDFENASSTFLYSTGRDTVIIKQEQEVKEGQFSGRIFMEDDMDFFEATSLPFTSLPIGGTLYLEMDFKTNENVIVGVFLDGEQHAHITLNTTDVWRKTYLNLKEIVKAKPNAREVKIFLGLKEENGTIFRTDNPDIYLDNIKLVHF